MEHLLDTRVSLSIHRNRHMNSTPVWGTILNLLVKNGLDPHEVVKLFNVSSSVSTYLNIKSKKKIGARVILPKNNSKKKRIVLKVTAFEKTTGEIITKRFTSFPGKSFEEKLAYALLEAEEFNEQIHKGKCFTYSTPQPKYVTIAQAIKIVTDEKRHTRSFKERLPTYFKPYLDYCKSQNCLQMNIEYIDVRHANGFLSYLKNMGIASRTVNNYMQYAKNIYNRMVDLEYLERSPFRRIKALPTPTGKNIAYTEPEIARLNEMHEIHPDLGFVAKIMYYTLARTNEICHIQRKHIEMYNKNQLYIPAEISKNNHERHINIPGPLMDLFHDRGIMDLDPEWFIVSCKTKILGNTYKPIEPLSFKMATRRLGERYRQHILNPAGFTTMHTLYSWKHTGVIMAHRAGVPDSDIMQQTGHLDYGSFVKYMKSLGRFHAGKYAELIPEI